ncbi:Uncharacterised protein [Mycobacteroides abscessus]|nr:Uncharacterised protein [Mycobacteroides abscessus]
MLSAGLARRRRTKRPRNPTRNPTSTATATANTKSPATDHSDTRVADPPVATAIPIPAMAERRSTSADASLSRLSPSSSVTTRGDAPSRLTMDVATASVGLTMAPSAKPAASGMPGMSHVKR